MKTTFAAAKKAFEYDPDTGHITWKRVFDSWGRPNEREFGKIAGRVGVNGYRYISLKGHHMLAHRLAWLLMTRKWPANLIDHVNGKRDDNRWKNLRDADKSKNGQNYIKPKSNKTGYRGVRKHHKSGKWMARIRANGKETHLGLFNTAEQAGRAYIEASIKFFGEFSPHG